MEPKTVFTNNQGPLKIVLPFEFARGIQNKDVCMGIAVNKKGERFEIYPASCAGVNDGITSTCYCFATALRVE